MAVSVFSYPFFDCRKCEGALWALIKYFFCVLGEKFAIHFPHYY